MKGRFAPSPTGYIHLGNVWIALLSYISARQQGGTYVVRMEDIDLQRAKRSFGETLLDDLEWLGLDWDEGPRVGGPASSYWQSERLFIYDSVLQSLQANDLLYPCFCNRSRLQSIASAPHRSEVVHHYDGHCRHMNQEEQRIMIQQKQPSYRLKVDNEEISFVDFYQGRNTYKLQAEIDDFVLRRGDGMYAYNLAVVIDDIQMGITEVIRGCDLLNTTAQQMYLYHQLQRIDIDTSTIPVYGHAPLLIDSQGNRLSKRQQSITIRELRELQWTPERILGELAVLAGLIPSRSHPEIGMTDLVQCNIHNSVLQKDSIIVSI